MAPLPRASQELSLKDALTRSELNISRIEGRPRRFTDRTEILR